MDFLPKSVGKYAKNHWYVAAWSSEVADKPFARQLMDERVVMFRDAEGKIAALIDRCAHRLAPLSMGECVNGNIRCGYHGMEYDSAGKCVNVPGQAIIPPTAPPKITQYLMSDLAVWKGLVQMAF